MFRAVARMLIGGRGYIFISSCFQIDQFEFDLTRNSSGRTEYMNIHSPPPPPINVPATALCLCF